MRLGPVAIKDLTQRTQKQDGEKSKTVTAFTAETQGAQRETGSKSAAWGRLMECWYEARAVLGRAVTRFSSN